MTVPAFDGSEYRRTVLSQLRERNPSEVEDLFWLAHLPRDVDDAAAVAARLRETKGFLNKERSRARQAAIALAVLKQWPRVEGVLGDPAARSALRERLASEAKAAAPATRAGPGRSSSAARAGAGRSARSRSAAAASDPAARRRRQAASSLSELARLRQEPELAEDLFAFLGLPVTATKPMIEERLVRVGEVNRRRRPDRERTLVDELLEHARELLVSGDPQAYLAGSTDSARDGVVDALLSGDERSARQALARARTHGVSDAAVLSGVAAAAEDAGDTVPLSAVGLGLWCPSCTTVNAAGARVCSGCAATLTIACTSCRTPVAADLARCPSCGASLDDARAPLLARRVQERGQRAALAEVEAAPEGERQALLSRLAGEHPEWNEVRRRARMAPPQAPAHVTLELADGEARLSWPRSEEPGVNAYLVERVQGATRRVLGRTAVTTWTDAQPPAADTAWSVRALRGESASVPTTAARAGAGAPRPSGVLTPAARAAAGSSPPGGALADVRAVAGLPVELSWRAPASGQVTLVRIERRADGDIERRLSVDPTGYRDRQVGRGRRYEYRVSIAGSTAPPVVLELEAGSGATVRAAPAASGRPSASARPPASAPAPASASAPAPAPASASASARTSARAPAPARASAAAPASASASASASAQTSEAPTTLDGVTAVRDADGRLRVTWRWPPGVTEAYVAFGHRPPAGAGEQGRKVTNMRYELDGGALLAGVPAGAHVAVFTGRRDAAGVLRWDPAAERSRTVAP